jgi:hypothetical protein
MTNGIDPQVVLRATHDAGAALYSAINLVESKKVDLSNRLAAANNSLEATGVALDELAAASQQLTPDLAAKATNAIEKSTAALKATSELISAVGFTGTVGSPVDEWKECRATIDRCDKILVDLRKTGFGFVTAVVGVAAYVLNDRVEFAPKASILTMLVLLIVTLYIVDLAHQTWLSVSVRRAEELERRLNFALTQNISVGYAAAKAVYVGLALYLILLAATSGIFWFSEWKEQWDSGHHVTVLALSVAGAVLMVIAFRWSGKTQGQAGTVANPNPPALPPAPPQQSVRSLEEEKTSLADLEKRINEAQATQAKRRSQ